MLVDGGKYFLIRFADKPGHVEKFLPLLRVSMLI